MATSEENIVQTSELGDSTAVGRLVSQMRQAVEKGDLRVGDKIATLRNLSQKYEISFDATRGAIARLESLGYLTRKRGSGTFVADWQKKQGVMDQPRHGIIKQQNKTVALLLDNKVHHHGRFYDHLVDCLQLGGYKSSVFTWRQGWGDEEMLPVLEHLEQDPPHAIVIQQLDGGRYDQQVEAIANKNGTRVISSFLGWPQRPERWHAVLADTQAAASIATRYLLNQGHKRIGLIVHDRHITQTEPATWRKRWYGHSFLILGVGHEMRRDNIRHGMRVYYQQRIDKIHGADPTHVINKELVCKWLSEPNCPTAFIGEDFRMAALLRTAQENNIKLPDNFQVVGIGNTPWASLMGFSSVWLREDLAAEHVINLVQMNDRLFEGVAHQIKLQPQLIERS